MPITVHNPDRFMSELRTIVAQGRKRIGLLIGAGAAASLPNVENGQPLIPAIDGITKLAIEALDGKYLEAAKAVSAKTPTPNIEGMLSRIRSLAKLLKDDEIDGLNGAGYSELGAKICAAIGKAVDVKLPAGENAYTHLVSWIAGTDRDHAIEVFTTNYDLLLEQALEQVRAPYFDGFAGAREPFFDSVSVANDDLPARWTRLWKLHGSLGWSANSRDEVIRTGQTSSTHLIFPDFLKYDQTQKAPYAALFDRLRDFLTTKDTLLVACGCSFADAHVSAKIDEALAANPAASVLAFQFRSIDEEPVARELGLRRPNFSVYARDKAIVNGVVGDWKPGDPLSRDWDAIRATYWDKGNGAGPFLLGDFSALARFLALSKSGQAFADLKLVPAAEAAK